METAAGKLLELLAGGAPALVGGGLPDLDLDRGRAGHRVFANNIHFKKLRESSDEWKMFEMEGRLERPVSIRRVSKKEVHMGSHLFCIPFASLSLMADMTGDKR